MRINDASNLIAVIGTSIVMGLGAWGAYSVVNNAEGQETSKDKTHQKIIINQDSTSSIDDTVNGEDDDSSTPPSPEHEEVQSAYRNAVNYLSGQINAYQNRVHKLESIKAEHISGGIGNLGEAVADAIEYENHNAASRRGNDHRAAEDGIQSLGEGAGHAYNINTLNQMLSSYREKVDDLKDTKEDLTDGYSNYLDGEENNEFISQLNRINSEAGVHGSYRDSEYGVGDHLRDRDGTISRGTGWD